MKILFCGTSSAVQLLRLKELLSEHEIITSPHDAVADHLAGVDIILPGGATIDSNIIKKGQFGLIQQFGVGLDTIDIEAATHAGVWVAHVAAATSGNADSVAEHAILLMLMLSRHFAQTQAALQQRQLNQPEGLALSGKTACIVGLGDVGTAIAKRLRAFNMRLTAVREHTEKGAPSDMAIEQVYSAHDLQPALQNADYAVLCINYTAETHNLINDSVLRAMKPGAFLINIARGGLVDTDALLAALKSGQLAGAGLDVVWQEPIDPHHPLLQQNVIVTPHVAGVTDVAVEGIAEAVAENIRRYAGREAPIDAVNLPSNPRRSLGS